MHERLRMLETLPPLRDPVLLVALTGWTDAAGIATSALDYLIAQWGARAIAEIDPEPFYDFTVQRPHVRLEDGQRVLDWPRNRCYLASPPGANRDILLLVGAEPHLRWRMFTDVIVELMRTVGTTTTITLGAQPAAVPHTRPLPVTLSASDAAFEEQFGLKIPVSRYEGPTGIIGVLNVGLRALGWRNASLWALIPHYLNAGANPNAIVSLVRALDRGFGTDTPLAEIEERVAKFADQVDEAMEHTAEADAYVRTLEEQFDQTAQGAGEPAPAPTELPSSAELLGDLERFLREQRDDS
ncbi:MAG: PAC2 family protein [Dehalococcoidia bacterium]|nr:PAC2 family protein [Dehalococcoidia bacterium]